MVTNPGIPIPSAMPRVFLETPFNGAEDGEDADVGDCTVDGVKVIVTGTDAEVNTVSVESTCKVGCDVGVAEDIDDLGWSVMLKCVDQKFSLSKKQKVFESLRLNPSAWTVQTKELVPSPPIRMGSSPISKMVIFVSPF